MKIPDVIQALLLVQIPAAFFFTAVLAQSDSSSVVVAGYNVSAPTGSRVGNCRCVSGRHGVDQGQSEGQTEGGPLGPVPPRARLCHGEGCRHVLCWRPAHPITDTTRGRVSLSQSAFNDGNFSLVIRDIAISDRGLYSCNLHHHYCHLYETIRIQVNVTKSRRKEQRFWDGQKAVFVVLVGSTVVLPCVNRRSVWTEDGSEEEQQVVHWDRQPPGVRHDRADRLIDLYASGEQRSYGPLFLQRKMNISAESFTQGDFSLAISALQPGDQGLYTCHLHHHYCGLHERRQFQLTVGPAEPQATVAPRALPNQDKEDSKAEAPRVINFILPDQRHHFLLPLGYILTTLLLLAFIVLIIIIITHRRKTKAVEFYPQTSMRSHRGDMATNEFEMDVPEVKTCNQEEKKLDYKNNLLREKVQMSTLPKVIDLDKEMEKVYWK